MFSETIRREHDPLAEEVAQHVVNRYELDLPAKKFKHVLFLSDKFIIAVRDLSEAQKLVDPRVSLLKVLGADKDTCERDQHHDVVLGFMLEVGQVAQMSLDISSEQIGIE